MRPVVEMIKDEAGEWLDELVDPPEWAEIELDRLEALCWDVSWAIKRVGT